MHLLYSKPVVQLSERGATRIFGVSIVVGMIGFIYGAWTMAIGAGGFFVLGGLLACRLENELPAKILWASAALVFMAIINRVAFGAGKRTGTVRSPLTRKRLKIPAK